MFDLRQAPNPFAMRPGLARMPQGAAHLHALDATSALAAEKHSALANRTSALLLAADLDDEAQQLSMQALLAQRNADTTNSVAKNAIKTLTPGQKHIKIGNSNGFAAFMREFSLSVQEDLALLDARPHLPAQQRGRLAWLNVCCPSHWAPEEKIGLPLLAVHAPVADNAMLLQANAGLVTLATNGQRWQRWVWTITPSAKHDAHPCHDKPGKRLRVWPSTADPRAFLQACYLRSESQTFFPVLDDAGQPSGMAIFTIRVHITPLLDALPTPEHTAALHASLQTMSPAVLAYKGLTTAQPTLLRALANLMNTK